MLSVAFLKDSSMTSIKLRTNHIRKYKITSKYILNNYLQRKKEQEEIAKLKIDISFFQKLLITLIILFMMKSHLKIRQMLSLHFKKIRSFLISFTNFFRRLIYILNIVRSNFKMTFLNLRNMRHCSLRID